MLSLMVLGCFPVAATSGNVDEADVLLGQAVEAIKKGEDNSIRDELLKAAYELDPDSAQINWQILWSSSRALRKKGSMPSRAIGLANLADDVDKIKGLAKKRGELAFMHYVQARYLSAYNLYDSAEIEINKALEIEPGSSRYLFVKASLLASKGYWDVVDGDSWRIQSNQILESMKGLDLSQSRHINKYDIFFNLAYNEAALKQENPNKTIKYYLKSLDSEGAGVQDHFVWNNISIAYRKLGVCQKAFDAAKKAIEVSKYGSFGAAETNLRNANYCLEMKKMDIL